MARYFTRTDSTNEEFLGWGQPGHYCTRLYYRKRWYLPKQLLSYWLYYTKRMPQDVRNEIKLLIKQDKSLRNG